MKKVAETVGMSERRIRDVLKGRVLLHPRHRSVLVSLIHESASPAQDSEGSSKRMLDTLKIDQ